MKREIKFRAWTGKVMYSNGYIIIKNNSTYHNLGTKSVERTDWKVMQYTGLKDENGKEIYEQMEIDDNFEVSFDNGSYILTNISNGDIILLYNYLKEKNGQIKITKEYTEV